METDVSGSAGGRSAVGSGFLCGHRHQLNQHIAVPLDNGVALETIGPIQTAPRAVETPAMFRTQEHVIVQSAVAEGCPLVRAQALKATQPHTGAYQDQVSFADAHSIGNLRRHLVGPRHDVPRGVND